MMEVVKYTDTEGELKFNNIDISIINGLRRVMISEIPVYAISVVLVEINNSKMNEEYLVNRLGLIPFIQGKDNYNISDNLIEYDIELNVSHLDENEEFKNIYARDFLIKDDLLSNNLIPVHPDIFICKLMKGDKISLKCKLLKGVGKKHSRWSTVSSAIYKNIESDNILFQYESIGILKPKEILEKSKNIIIKKLKDFRDAVKNEKI
jgi:DNA-directed RNA polymerase alpha subunit